MTGRSADWVPRLVCLLGLYITVEETLVKWLFGSGDVAAFVRQMPDLVIIGLAGGVLAMRLSDLRAPSFSSSTPTWLALFAVYAIATIATSNGDLLYSVLNLKAFLRYVLLFVILHYFPFDSRSRRFLWQTILVATGIQALVCSWQYIGGESIRDLLVPEDIESDDPRFAKLFTGARFEGVNDLVGTMGNNIGLSYFLVIVLTLWLARTPGTATRWLGAMVLVGWNVFTGSRAGLLASAVIMVLFESRRLTAGARLAVGMMTGAFFVMTLAVMAGKAEQGSLLYVFNPGYLQEAVNQRLGLVMYLLPELAFSPVVLLGLGPDKYQYPYFFEEVGIHLPWILMAVIPNIIEDVYWIAIVVSYGAFGATLFALALRSAWTGLGAGVIGSVDGCDWVRRAGRLLIVGSLVLGLFSQVFHLRQFSYFFWLILAIGLQARPAWPKREEQERDSFVQAGHHAGRTGS